MVSGSDRSVKAETATVVHMPDLIDTGDPEDYSGTDNFKKNPSDQNIANLTAPSTPLIDDLFGDSPGAGISEQKRDDDPFADVSFHTGEGREQVDDLFSGMTVDDKPGVTENLAAADKSGPEPFDIFGSQSEILQKQEHQNNSVNDLMAGLSINDNQVTQKEAFSGVPSESISSNSSSNPNQVSSDVLGSLLGSQTAGMNANPMFPFGAVPYSIPAGMMFNPSITSQPINYSAVGNFFAQQQFLATMSNFQHLGDLNAQNAGVSHVVGNGGTALPDIFQSNFPNQAPTSTMNSSKKEDTRAFDFISVSLSPGC